MPSRIRSDMDVKAFKSITHINLAYTAMENCREIGMTSTAQMTSFLCGPCSISVIT